MIIIILATYICWTKLTKNAKKLVKVDAQFFFNSKSFHTRKTKKKTMEEKKRPVPRNHSGNEAPVPPSLPPLPQLANNTSCDGPEENPKKATQREARGSGKGGIRLRRYNWRWGRRPAGGAPRRTTEAAAPGAGRRPCCAGWPATPTPQTPPTPPDPPPGRK